ncbi:33283_t:CDS:2, partial [Racocetra persica]
LGAILAQKDKNHKKYVIAYASRGLSKTKRNYSALELYTSAPKGKRARWILRLQLYDYRIVHRVERKHSNVDWKALPGSVETSQTDAKGPASRSL